MVFASLLLILPVMAAPLRSDAQALRPQPGGSVISPYGNRQYHLVSTPAQRIVATLNEDDQVSHLQPRQWLVYAPDAPDTDDQSAAFSTLAVANTHGRSSTWSELSPLARKLLTVRLYDESSFDACSSEQSSLNTSATYTALLYRRALMPGAPAHAPAPLSDAARQLYTRSSATIDYNAPAFQAWLDQARLRRAPGERDLDFALKVFRRIRSAYTYSYDLAQDRRASAICRCASSDCGGLSQLFVAALRANEIPAVALCGRIARSAPGEASLSGSAGNVHVKSQFYAAGVGWVPVEMSGAVYDRAAPEHIYFGRSAGDFLTLSVGNDLELSLDNGAVVSQRGLQGIRLWVWGVPDGSISGSAPGAATRSTTCWSVRQLPIITAGRQIADANP